MMFEKIQKVIVEQLGLKDKNVITPQTDLKAELKVDSLDLSEMLMNLEEELGIEIPTEKALSIKTVGEMAALLEGIAK